ncbi:MAG: FdtA/QdtA family cupin domain-containing protein [Solobacterium sp.]|nr:FdtA/QdtA family cupin domain-containing protein [Solobacterium sp.]
MEFYKILEFKELGDERGNLVAIEGGMDIPFEVKRVFYMYGTDDTMVRGQHANRRSQFVLINVSGSSRIKVDDGRGHTEIINMDKPRIGVYLPPMIWKEMYDFSQNSTILCLTDTHYDPKEYIRDYDEYLRERNG